MYIELYVYPLQMSCRVLQSQRWYAFSNNNAIIKQIAKHKHSWTVFVKKFVDHYQRSEHETCTVYSAIVQQSLCYQKFSSAKSRILGNLKLVYESVVIQTGYYSLDKD